MLTAAIATRGSRAQTFVDTRVLLVTCVSLTQGDLKTDLLGSAHARGLSHQGLVQQSTARSHPNVAFICGPTVGAWGLEPSLELSGEKGPLKGFWKAPPSFYFHWERRGRRTPSKSHLKSGVRGPESLKHGLPLGPQVKVGPCWIIKAAIAPYTLGVECSPPYGT